MPILEIEIVLRPGETIPTALAAELADAAGKLFDSARGGTWVKLGALPAENYAENASPAGVYPVFVTILKAHLPEADAMQVEVTRLTRLIARLCERPVDNVHIFYQPDAVGRVAFGGKLVSE